MRIRTQSSEKSMLEHRNKGRRHLGANRRHGSFFSLSVFVFSLSPILCKIPLAVFLTAECLAWPLHILPPPLTHSSLKPRRKTRTRLYRKTHSPPIVSLFIVCCARICQLPSSLGHSTPSRLFRARVCASEKGEPSTERVGLSMHASSSSSQVPN